jgi:hypothetical protein
MGLHLSEEDAATFAEQGALRVGAAPDARSLAGLGLPLRIGSPATPERDCRVFRRSDRSLLQERRLVD